MTITARAKAGGQRVATVVLYLNDVEAGGETVFPELELSIKPDGTLNQVVIARTSGILPFDAAAIDAVGSAAPFGEPPQAIKSRDGNVYISWHFHRDERQCATDFVNAHILTAPPKAGSGTFFGTLLDQTIQNLNRPREQSPNRDAL